MGDNIVENWLKSIELEKYAQAFVDNGYDDLEICKQVGGPDLDAIGVESPSDREIILDAVKTLKEKGGTAVYLTLEDESNKKGTKEKSEHVPTRPTLDNLLSDVPPPSPGPPPTPKKELENEGADENYIIYQKIELTCIVRDKLTEDRIDLASPPYTLQNWSPCWSSLTALAVKYAEELRTRMEEVLDRLEDLRWWKISEDTASIYTPPSMTSSTMEDHYNQSLYSYSPRGGPPPIPSVPPPDGTHAGLYAEDSYGQLQSVQTRYTDNPSTANYVALETDSEMSEKKKTSTLGRLFRNMGFRRSSRKHSYKKHSGDLVAHEITMSDNDRIALMQMVKEGKISTETALQVIEETQTRCIICKKDFDEDDVKVTLGQKGCDGVNRASAERGDTLTALLGQRVHTDCRKDYCNKNKIKADKSSTVSLESRKLRSSSGTFIFKERCLFCGKTAQTYGNKRGNDVFPVRTLDFQNSIEELCIKRADTWGHLVKGRLETVNDLPAADAIYHQVCSVNFRTGKDIPTSYDHDEGSTTLKRSKGRPSQSETKNSFLNVIDYFIANDDEQITINELVRKMQDQCGDEAYSAVHMKRKLKEHFGENLIFTNSPGKNDVVTLKNTASSILHSFYKQQQNEGEEESSIIEAAAKLIKRDIKSLPNDQSEYPSSSDISSSERNLDYLPDSLKLLLHAIVGKSSDIKVAAIGQAIIQATRPRVIMTPLQLSLGIQMHHQFASKFLINTLNSLGYCVSYSEIQKFESCAAVTKGTDIPGFIPGSFIQYVADNVDHNSRTIDGHNSFHGMGIIACATPGNYSNQAIKRRKVEKEELCSAADIRISYCDPSRPLKNVHYKELEMIKALDKTWKLDILVKIVAPLRESRLSYSGHMQMLQTGEHPGKASVIFMPMIDLDPGDLNCIYTTLKFVKDHADRYSVTPILTFDQPLYWKAYTIILREHEDSPLQKIVLRLGGFHTMMSFLGSIGHLMQGSGLQEVLETVYAQNTVVHMLSGKAYARSIRGHFLVESVLMMMLASEAFGIGIPSTTESKQSIDGEDVENQKLTNSSQSTSQKILTEAGQLLDSLSNGQIDLQGIADSALLDSACRILNEHKKTLLGNRTATLWLQYIDMVQLLQTFLKAERTGDWDLHLSALAKMLPYLGSSGHNLYLKSAHVYLQTMETLEITHPDLIRHFRNGLHVVRRSDRFWAGLSADLVIEQVLMRSVKTNGGLTRGKGITEDQRAKWLLSLPACAEFNKNMQDLLGITYHTSDQHKECSTARLERDTKDSQTILSFLLERNPFVPCTSLRNIESGVEADSKVNVEEAKGIGNAIMAKMIGKNIFEHKFKKDQQAVVLTTKPVIRLDDGETIQVDPQLLFQRLITAALRQEDDISHYFSYELSSVPSTLFDTSGFPRQPQKATLADTIWSLGDCRGEDLNDFQYVLDGGALIHRIPWNQGTPFQSICESYTEFVTKQYSNAIIVFDGYISGPTIKDVAHLRRSHGVTGTNVTFTESTPFRGNKNKFLSNSSNKQNFINLLGTYLSNIGCRVLFAEDDADVLIVKTAVTCADKCATVLIGEDTDLLVLLCFHTKQDSYKILLKSGSKSTTSKGLKVWDIHKTQSILGETACKILPFVHAFTGCDSISKIHGIGKGTTLKKFITNRQLAINAEVFLSNTSVKLDIERAGEKIMVSLFGGHETEGLDLMRFRVFSRKVTVGVTCVQIQSIPPTAAAAKYHSLRTFFQVQVWISEICALKPTEYGWYEHKSKLYPVKTDAPPAPQTLIKMIKCNCKANCDTKRCTCRKHGLECSGGCGECKGIQCNNVSLNEEPYLEDDATIVE